MVQVKAKRLGWDEVDSVTDNDILDPYEYTSDDLIGEYETIKAIGPYVVEHTNHLVDWELADPTTIVPIDNTLNEQRSLPLAEINRSILRDANPCPQCQANNDPQNIPVHFGCDCSIITDSINSQPVSENEFTDLIRFLSQFDVIDPVLIRPGTILPSNLSVLRDTLVNIGLDLRFSDLRTYLQQNQELLNAGNVLAIMTQDTSTILMLNAITEITFPGHWTPKIKRDHSNNFVIVFPQNTTESELATAFKLLMEWRNANKQK